MAGKGSKWEIALQGKESCLSFLSETFGIAECDIDRRGNEWTLRSSLFERCDDAAELREPVSRVLDQANGLMRIVKPDYPPVRRGIVHRLENGKVSNRIITADAVCVMASLTTGSLDASDLERCLPIAIEGGALGAVLAVLSREDPTWPQLFLALEAMRNSAHGRELLKRHARKVKLLEWTANNYEVLGVDARHARNMCRPPRRPMEWHEAIRLVRTLARELVSRASAEG